MTWQTKHHYFYRPHYIYVIVDPRTKYPAYVGMTVDPKARYEGHDYCGRSHHRKPLYLWWSNLLSDDVKPEMHIVAEAVGEVRAREIERQVAIGYLNRGCILLNDKKIMRIEFQGDAYFEKGSYWKTRKYGRLLTA